MARTQQTKTTAPATKRGQLAYDPASMRVIVLYGDDDFLMREYTRQVMTALRDHFGEIEEFFLDGETARLADVLDELRSYGLIQRHKLVLLDNADEFLKASGDDEDDDAASSSRAQHRPAMERYAAAPVDHGTLLMRSRTWRKGKIDKLIQKCGLIFNAKKPNETQALSWAERRCKKQYGCEINSDAAALLVEQVGADLARLDVEMAKLAAYAGDGEQITRDMVAQMVGLSREEKVWSIQAAIATGDPKRVMAKLDEFRPITQQMEVLIGWSIMDLMKKVHAASRMLQQGAAPGSIIRPLKLWGDPQPIIAAARRLSPNRAADLFDQAVKIDHANKSGIGQSVRNLESLLIKITDEISRDT